MKSCEEWSTEFDILFDNIMSHQAPGLTEYEKSVFLTRAEEAVVVGLYKGTLGDAFESTEEVTAYLGPLVAQSTITEETETDAEGNELPKVTSDSRIYKNPSDMLFRTLEFVTAITGCGSAQIPVVPTTQDEVHRTLANPFKGAGIRRALRLSYKLWEDQAEPDYVDIGDDDNDSSNEETEKVCNTYSEIICSYPVTSYTVRYIKRPEPIILENLSDGLTVNGESAAKTCKLDEALHQTILVEAVKLAKSVWNA